MASQILSQVAKLYFPEGEIEIIEEDPERVSAFIDCKSEIEVILVVEERVTDTSTTYSVVVGERLEKWAIEKGLIVKVLS